MHRDSAPVPSRCWCSGTRPAEAGRPARLVWTAVLLALALAGPGARLGLLLLVGAGLLALLSVS
jgi:hypothetical protein